MNDIFSLVDSLNLQARSESAKLSETIESQLITLKWKVARCSKNCFVTSPTLQGALKCERACNSAVSSTTDFIKKATDRVNGEFKACLSRLEDSFEGKSDDVASAEEEVSLCYRRLTNSIEGLREKIIEEFSYYE